LVPIFTVPRLGAALLVLQAACGSSSGYPSDPGGGSSNPVQTATISVDNPYTFTPSTVRVVKGGTVTWTWTGTGHNVTSVLSPSFSPGSGTHDAPWTYGPVTFDNAGSYRFICSVHGAVSGSNVSGMNGTVTVQ
jgi:plastocyanin